MQFILVLTTAPSEQQAAALASSLVEARLAACVHIQAIRSVYRWQGEVHDEPEWRLAIKTTAAQYAAVEQHIRERHSYDTPEIVRLTLDGGSEKYLAWIADSVGAADIKPA